MGKKVFISYAEENRKIAGEIIVQLKKVGLHVDDWRDPLKRGKRFIQRIQDEIREANIFLVVLSPAYLDSRYCGREASFALQLEKDNEQFIYVVLAKAVETEDAGFLAEYDYFDLTRKTYQEELIKLIRIIAGNIEIAPILDHEIEIYQPDFQNREEELDELISNLTKATGGVHFWQILAPPQMGKSWFMQKLASELPTKSSKAWNIRSIDLRQNPKSLKLRSDASALLSEFFDLKVNRENKNPRAIKIAQQIGRSKQLWLLLLDGAELLSDKTAKNVLDTLSQINFHLQNHRDIRLAFVAVSRRYFDVWMKVRTDYPRFRMRRLSPFTRNVIYSTLDSMVEKDGVNVGSSWIKKTADQLHRVTEGLPALLVRYLGWIRNNSYIFGPDDLESPSLFRKLAIPYIEETVLSPDSLLPGEGNANHIEPKCDILKTALSQLCVYRRFIARYLDGLIKGQPELASKLNDLEWTTINLHEALKCTYLMEPLANDLWTVFYPAVRRLLFRYYYLTFEQQAQVHQQAVQFYKDRWQEWIGTDRAIVILEHLWHQIESQHLQDGGNLANITKLAKTTIDIESKSERYSSYEIAAMVKARMLEDIEFQTVTQQIDIGLFDRLLDIL